MEHHGKTILDYFKVVRRSSKNDNARYSSGDKQHTDQINSPIKKTKKRSANYFDGCIVIDDDDDNITKDEGEDDDIKEIEQQE
jgi:hypothetical protein